MLYAVRNKKPVTTSSSDVPSLSIFFGPVFFTWTVSSDAWAPRGVLNPIMVSTPSYRGRSLLAVVKRLALRASVHFIRTVRNVAIFLRALCCLGREFKAVSANSIQCRLLGMSSKWREKMLMNRNPLLDRWGISLAAV